MNRAMKSWAAGASLAVLSLAVPAHAEGGKLPSSTVWTAYDLGSSGYAEASGIANALMKNYQTRVRIVPSGTSIGRLLPITTGKADYGFLANEVYFAAEGTFDFSTRQWGPQDLRIVLGRPANVGLAVAKDTGVKQISDLKGKRVGFVKGNPSVNVKNEAYLAFGGLTPDDVEQVWFGSYGAMKEALIANQLDAFGSVTTSANMREIEASPRGLYWPPFPAENKAGWKAMTDVVSFAEPSVETQGAGVSEDNPVTLVGYRYPMITAYARKGADEVHTLVEAVEATFDDYRNTTSSSSNWEVKRSGLPPADAPFHEGTIRYMKEKGYWNNEAQAWHDARLARLEKVIAGWEEASASFEKMREEETAKGNKIDADEAWGPYWDKYRAAHLAPGT